MMTMAVTVLAVAGIQAVVTPLSALAAVPEGSAAGTDIGNATQLTGTAAGSLSTSLSNDWWVIYPASVGGAVTLQATNTTTNGTSGCDSVFVDIYGTDGVTDLLGQAVISSNSSYVFSNISTADSDRYFVEAQTGGCAPQAGRAVSYSLHLTSGGGGASPDPSTGAVSAAPSIGDTWPPLQGHTSYTGTLTTSATEAWYALYESVSSQAATVRVENTTVDGSTSCSSPTLYADLYGANGVGQLDGQAVLPDNGAYVFTIPATGVSNTLYYLEITDPGCTSGGIAYRVEPEAAAQFSQPQQVPAGSIAAGDAIGTSAWPPLEGHTSYTGTMTSGTTEAWYSLFEKSGVASTIRVENTTVDGSISCSSPTLYADFYGADGVAQLEGQAVLPNNGAYVIPVPTTGVSNTPYYLEITDPGCTTGGLSYELEPEPSTGWTNPGQPATDVLPVGSTSGAAGGPLAGGATYTDDVSTTPQWSEFYSDGTSAVTVTVANTTDSQDNCNGNVVQVDLEDTNGLQDSAQLPDDAAASMAVDTKTLFKIEISNSTTCPTGDTPMVQLTLDPPQTTLPPNEITAYNYFISKGFNAAQAAGIVGNLQQEDPGLIPTRKQTNGPAMGIAQWEPPRWTQLKAYEGKNALTLQGQLDFIWHELQTTEAGAYSAVKACTTVSCATQKFEAKYEGAGSPNMPARIAFANAIYALCSEYDCASL
jgi:hypothetical protein